MVDETKVTYPYTCKESDRVDACTMHIGNFAQGVCGNDKNKKLTYFGNLCSACANREIVTVYGGCPKKSQLASADKRYPYFCQSSDRNQVCTEEWLGVCAWNNADANCKSNPCSATSGTICQACTMSKVAFVTKGECSKDNTSPTAASPYYCKDLDRNKPCTKEYRGVCAWTAPFKDQCKTQPCYKTRATICTACAAEETLFVIDGICEKMVKGSSFINLSLIQLFLVLVYILS